LKSLGFVAVVVVFCSFLCKRKNAVVMDFFGC
jgi:hypothetical protein